jgi:hypothetical protein
MIPTEVIVLVGRHVHRETIWDTAFVRRAVDEFGPISTISVMTSAAHSAVRRQVQYAQKFAHIETYLLHAIRRDNRLTHPRLEKILSF